MNPRPAGPSIAERKGERASYAFSISTIAMDRSEVPDYLENFKP